jgi:hypothetical protein
VLSICSFVALLTTPLGAVAQDATPPAATGSLSVVLGGLTNPRGFTWADDGTLYLALAGTGGPNQVIAEGTPFPFFGGTTSSIVKIVDGCPVPVAEGFASFIWTDPGWVWGVMDVAFLNGQLYALSGGGGADTGQPEHPNGVYAVNADGTSTLVADLSAWFRENPTTFIPPDYGADGSLFDMEAGTDALYVSEAVGGRVLKIAPDGTITLLSDQSEAHMVPTGIALAPDGGVYLGFETTIPYPEGSSKVIHIAADGTSTDVWTGLTAVTDVVLGPDGVLYAAEMSADTLDEPPYLQLGTGRIVRQTGPDSLEVLVEGIDYPAYLGFGPDGALYADGPAFGANDGEGWLGRVEMNGGGMAVTPAACPAMATPTS